ncbi:glycosyltransferase [Nonomuraea zeae]|uniref:Glycosyltransferase family 1 protein n=1 Tax=Nonomuraea zeae TaxID=1642303 RepID=A0A5S4GW40_9ACTN|nr:glycosyltransferase [Nonomuraea zeae]TMR36711.1 glycosyltransferase family 1 protein [Nonomuraea zeae]
MARILFTTHPASGHLRPLVPVAQAAKHRGHTVAVCAPACMAAELRSFGLDHLTGGYDWRYEVYRMLPDGYADQGFAEAAETFRALGEPLTRAYAGHVARGTAADILSSGWKPDLVVRELDELGGYLAAEALGVPHVPIISFGGLDGVTGARLGPILEQGRAELGLPPDPDGDALYRHFTASFLPPAFGASELILPRTRCYRHVNTQPRGSALPAWFAELDPAEPVIFAGFGTVVYSLPGSRGFVDRAIEALGSLGRTTVLAVGAGADPGQYAAPDNVLLVDFVDQALMLESCDLFITHGGLNSIKEALHAGVPMVALPVLDDHRHNAERCERLGLSRTVPLAAADGLGAAVHEVLTTPSYRAAARGIQRRMHALPPVDRLLDDLESLLTAIES